MALERPFNMFTYADSEALVLLHEQVQVKNNTQLRKSSIQFAVLNLAFRSFFMLAVLCSLVSMLAWVLWLNGEVRLSGALSPIVFHSHEMVFGFAATVAVGFLLTAVQTWTGKPSLQGTSLLPLIILWIGIRAGLYINSDISISIAIVLQSLWWLMAISTFSRLVISAKSTRNFLLIPLLIALMLLNISVLTLDIKGHSDISMHLMRTAAFMFCVLMSVIGGRVIPLFTKSGANLVSIRSPKALSITTIVATVLCAVAFFADRFIDLLSFLPILMITTGLLHLCRLAYWCSVKALKFSLLWSLHLSYLFVGLGLILVGLSSYSPYISFGNSLHVITVGAMGLMIFAMMSRVSLGHTGRKLEPTKLTTLLFSIIAVATLARFLMPVFSQHLMGWNLSAALWIGACVVFLWVYSPILLSPRK